jgi:hypothetical protein
LEAIGLSQARIDAWQGLSALRQKRPLRMRTALAVSGHSSSGRIAVSKNLLIRAEEVITANLQLSHFGLHHRFVLWDDGNTGEKPESARGVNNIGFSCDGPSSLAEHYQEMRQIGLARS